MNLFQSEWGIDYQLLRESQMRLECWLVFECPGYRHVSQTINLSLL
jgi:hypothetical protein